MHHTNSLPLIQVFQEASCPSLLVQVCFSQFPSFPICTFKAHPCFPFVRILFTKATGLWPPFHLSHPSPSFCLPNPFLLKFFYTQSVHLAMEEPLCLGQKLVIKEKVGKNLRLKPESTTSYEAPLGHFMSCLFTTEQHPRVHCSPHCKETNKYRVAPSALVM